MSKTLRDFDPRLVEVVEAALAPYRGRFSPDLIEHMREEALVLMSTHPYPVALLESSQPRPPADESHEVPRGGGELAGIAETDRAVNARPGARKR